MQIKDNAYVDRSYIMINLLFYDHKILNNTSSLVCFCFYERAHLIFDVLNRLTGGVFLQHLICVKSVYTVKNPFSKLSCLKNIVTKLPGLVHIQVFFHIFSRMQVLKIGETFFRQVSAYFSKWRGAYLPINLDKTKFEKNMQGKTPIKKNPSKTVTSPRLKS